MFKRKLLPCLIAAGIVAVSGCSKLGLGGPGSTGAGVVAADDPLTYVPADTPYVVANIDPQPTAVSDHWIALMDKNGKIGDVYAQSIDDGLKALADEGANCAAAAPAAPATAEPAPPAAPVSGGGGGGAMQDAPAVASPDSPAADSGDAASPEATDTASAMASAMNDVANAEDAAAPAEDKCSAEAVARREKATKLLGAFKDEVAGKDLKSLLDNFGLSTQMHTAFYGIGLVPVLRLELAKPDNLRAAIGRIETKSGTKLDTGKVGSVDYWQVSDPSAKVEGVFAITGKQFVATLAPVKASDADLKTLLGIDKPKKSLADSGDLAALNKKMGYSSFMSGYFDSAKLLNELKAPPSALESSFLAVLGTKKPQIDPVCAAEYGQIATAWPRASFGYTELTPQHVAVRAVLETRPDIAKDLMSLRAPMPGMGAAKTALANFGFSVNMGKLPELATKYANATANAPWKCPALAGLNDSTAKAKDSLTNPGLAGYTGMFHGLNLIADKIDVKPDQPIPDLSLVAVIGSDNPASLLAMAGNMVPGIANIGLKPDGTPKALPPMPNLPINAPIFAAMTDKVLALSLGAGEDARIADAMKLDPAQQPLLAGGARGDLYHVIAAYMRKGADAISDPKAKEMMQRQATAMDMYANWFKRVDMTVELTDQGIELHESVDTN
ncbi:MAG: hypothetical protein JSR34_06340 [Proteobacteria bacterium]|nr:hypothetical protein [Pseudomonadota bacterium]